MIDGCFTRVTSRVTTLGWPAGEEKLKKHEQFTVSGWPT